MLFSLLYITPFLATLASAYNLSISAAGGNVSSSLMYGLMFEDINYSGDGGIYAEMIRNRAFQGSTEHPSTLFPWTALGKSTLALQTTSVPLSAALPASINVSPTSGVTTGTIGISNPGWWGFSVKPQTYRGSFWTLGSYHGNFTVSLKSATTSQVFASAKVASLSPSTTAWHKHTYSLEPSTAAPDTNNVFTIEFDAGQGGVNFNLISLFPPTYKARQNGMRPDLMQALKGLNPSFLRMPGGNNIEGDSFHYPWLWNKTVGPLTSRPGRPGTWGYQNTDGLGLVEYFNWCTDLGMEPLLAVWSGMYLGTSDFVTAEALASHVQDTLNELEFILGDASTTYGALRASLGHPEPWELRYLEIGNEDNLNNGEDSYVSYRFKMFYDAITPRYPNLTLISSTGDLRAVAPGTDSDYHIYTRPDYFVYEMFSYFDNMPRDHKFWVGEYANIQWNIEGPVVSTNWSAPKLEHPIWVGAISEAVFAIGNERNGDLIVGMSYAPGFQNLNSYEWTTDMISFDADPAHTVLSTSYRGIELFGAAESRIASTVPVKSDSAFGPAYYVAGTSHLSTEVNPRYVFKFATYNATAPVPFNISFEGIRTGHTGKLTYLSEIPGDYPEGLGSNVLMNGKVTDVVKRTEMQIVAGKQGSFEFEVGNYVMGVLTVG